MIFEKGKEPEEKENEINKGLENYEDLPEDKVKRKDGLPTVDDLKEIFGKDKMPESKSDSVKDFIEVIIRIDK